MDTKLKLSKMKRFLILAIGLLSVLSLKAQYGNQFQYNAFFKTAGAFDYPSEVGTDIRKFSVNLFGANMYLGNSIADINWMYNVATNIETGTIDGQSYPVLRNDDGSTYLLPHVVLSHIVNETPSSNFLTGGAKIYPPLSIAYKVKAGEEKEEIATFSFNHSLRVGTSYHFGKDLFSFLYNGNGSFGAEPVNLIDFKLGFHAYSEWAVGAAFPVVELGNGLKVRAGFNLKYLVGYAAFDTRRANLNLVNDNGDVWTFNADYLFNLAVPPVAFDSTSSEIDPVSYGRNGIGQGIGIDFGASVQIFDNLKAYGSINDLGSVRYGGDGVRNIKGSESLTFDGVRVNVYSLDSFSFNADTLLGRFLPEVSSLDFNMPIATRLTLGAEFGLNEQETKKGDTYFKHNFHFTYIQGFNKAPGNSTRPFVNVAYSYRLKNILSVGANTGYGGIYGFNFGGFVGFRGGPFRFGLASNAVFAPLVPQLSKGIDFSINMAFAL